MSGWPGARDEDVGMMQKEFIRDRIVFAVALALVVSFSTPVRPATAETFDARCDVRPAEACPADPRPNPLLALAGDCAADLQRNGNCCAHSKSGARDYAIVKDCAAKKPQGYLLIPVKRIAGMDDPQIFNAAFVDLWQEAWRWSRKFPGQPAARTALAINSAGSRSEQQLHIHISCVDPEVGRTLEQAEIPVYPAKPLKLPVLGPRDHTYRAVRVSKLTGESSPFRVVMHQVGKSAMKNHGIAVIGSSGDGEFYVLETSEKDSGGHAEDLLDQRCGK